MSPDSVEISAVTFRLLLPTSISSGDPVPREVRLFAVQLGPSADPRPSCSEIRALLLDWGLTSCEVIHTSLRQSHRTFCVVSIPMARQRTVSTSLRSTRERLGSSMRSSISLVRWERRERLQVAFALRIVWWRL